VGINPLDGCDWLCFGTERITRGLCRWFGYRRLFNSRFSQHVFLVIMGTHRKMRAWREYRERCGDIWKDQDVRFKFTNANMFGIA